MTRLLGFLMVASIAVAGCGGNSAAKGGSYYHDTPEARANFLSVMHDDATLGKSSDADLLSISRSVCSLLQSKGGNYGKVEQLLAGDAPTLSQDTRQKLMNASIQQFCIHFSDKIPGLGG